MNKTLAVLATGCALALAGCGSVKNVTRDGSMQVYGGTRMGCYEWLGENAQNAGYCPGIGAFYLADKPLCLAADTVTLPYVLLYQWAKPNCRARDPFWDLFDLPARADTPKATLSAPAVDGRAETAAPSPTPASP